MLEQIGKAIKGIMPMSRDRPPKEHEYKEEIIEFVKSEHQRRQQERSPLELQWRLNINFVKGNQFMKINSDSRNIEQMDQFVWWEEREVFNQLAPVMETRLAKFNKLSTNLKVRPGLSEDREDIGKAKISNKLLPATKKKQKFKKLQKRANVWMELTGTSIYKTVWHPNKGRIIGKIATGGSDITKEEETNLQEFEKDIIKQDNQPLVKVIHEGDIHTTVHSPFEIYPDSIWNTIDECRSIIHAKVYSVDEVYEIWDKILEGKEYNVFNIQSSSGAVIGGIGQKGFSFSVSTAAKKDSILVYEYWELPSRRYPEGRLIICTDTELLYYDKLPDKLGDEEGEYKLPFVVQKCINNEEGFFGDCIITRLLPLQRRYNSIKNRIKEYLNRATIGNLAYQEGSIDEDLFEEEGIAPGDMIPYKQGFQPPTFMTYPSLPGEFLNELQDILTNFNRLSGVSEISKQSVTPSGVNSGVAIAALAEQDDTRVGLTADNIEEASIEIGIHWLKLYHNNAQFPRLLRHVGENNEVEAIQFTGSDITSFDVFIETTSELSETPAQRKQFVFELLNSGLLSDPDSGRITKEGRAKIFELLEMGNWEDFDNEDNLHIQKAERENQSIIKGEQVMPREFDDDLVHIKKHNNFRLTVDYEEMIRDNPIIDQLFEMHLQGHFINLQQKASANQQPQEEQVQQ